MIESEAELVDFTLPTGNDPRVEFKNTNPDTGGELKSILYKPGNASYLVCNSTFQAPYLHTKEYLYGYQEKTEADGRKTRENKNPRIAFLSDSNSPDDRNKDYGEIKFGSKDRFKWDNGGGGIYNDYGEIVHWNSAYGYLYMPKAKDTALTWGNDGVVVFRDSYGSLGTEGQVLTRTADANWMQWTTPADDGPKNWDLLNANDKNWGNEFYHQALTTGFGGYRSNGDEYNGQSNYGIFISDSMLEKLLKEDYPDKEIDIDQWVKYWTGEGTIELNTGNSGSSGTSQTRTLTEVKRVNYNNDGRYPGVKFMWADQYSLSFYALFIKFVKTQDAFIGTETDSAGSQILMPLEFPQVSGGQYVSDDQVQTVNKYGSSTGSDVYGYNMPWAWFEKEYPDIIGWVNDDGSAFISETRATLTVNTGQTRPGITIIGPYKINSYGNNLTIPGFVVRVDEVEEPQWGHKFP